MASAPNGSPGYNRLSQLRLSQSLFGSLACSGWPGREVVMVGISGLLGIWILLGGAFLLWRVDYHKRVQFGAEAIPTAIHSLSEKTPPHIAPELWTQAVVDTQAMLTRLVRSGALSQGQIEALRRELEHQAQEARPETAIPIVVDIWSKVEGRAKPIVAGLHYPSLLIPALAVRPLWGKKPAGVELDAWHLAIEQVYVLLARLAASGQLAPEKQESLSRWIFEKASQADSEKACKTLLEIWSEAASHLPNDCIPPRPELLNLPGSVQLPRAPS
jgi:hypothetical protein